MTEYSNDDSRLRAAEEQMRRALGLRDSTPTLQAPPAARPAQNPNASPRPHRRFVRDGEVQVEVVHHEGAGNNQLEAARQAIRTLTAARDQAERQLVDAQATIRDLQTKLAHERIAREEALQRSAAEGEDTERALQSARADLEAERAARRATEGQLAVALERSADAEPRGAKPKQPPLPLEAIESDAARGNNGKLTKPGGTPGRRRGRPPKAKAPEQEADFVEWWKPGWQQQFR